MKTKILIVLLLTLTKINSQTYINIGSTKEDVKSVMGEPTSIEKYYSEEVWSYGEYGLATITFQNNRIYEYNNYDKVLKIGNTKKQKYSKKNTKYKVPVSSKSYSDLIAETQRKQQENNPTFDMDAFFKEKGIDPKDVGWGDKNSEARLVENADELDRVTGHNWTFQNDDGVYKNILNSQKPWYEQSKYILSILGGILLLLIINLRITLKK